MSKLRISTISATLVLMLAATAYAETAPFTIAESVPDDVFLYVTARHNPERAYLDQYWMEVFDELKKSGVGGDLLGLFESFLDPDEQAQLQRMKTHIGELIGRVDWGGLVGGQFAFVERFPDFQAAEMDKFAGPPNMAWIFRGDKAAANYDALVALLRGSLDDVNHIIGSNTRLIVEDTTEYGARVARVTLSEGMSLGPSVTLTMTADGAKKLQMITGNNIGKRMAILLDGELLSGPITIMGPVSEYAVITGDFNAAELMEISRKITQAVADADANADRSPRLQLRFEADPATQVAADEFDNPNDPGAKLLLLKDSVLDERAVQSADISAPAHRPPPITFALAQRGDTVAAFLGEAMLDDVLGLMEGSSAKTPLADDERFKNAFAQLPPAEDSMVFFDMRKMARSFRELIDKAVSEKSSFAGDVVLNSTQSGPVHDLNMRAWQAYERQDYAGGLELVKQAYELSPTDSRVLYYLACFEALLGHEEQALTRLQQAVDGGFYSPRHISNDPDLESIRGDDRYTAAFEAAREHAEKEATERDAERVRLVRYALDRIFNAATILDYVAAVELTEDYSIRMESIAVLAPDAADRPFYPVFANQASLTAFDRFLPEETMSFSVSGGIDLDALYKFIEDSFHGAGPQGDALWAKWQGLQDQLCFDVKSNLLDWLAGDLISVTLENNGGTAWFIKVKDKDIARQKASQGLDFLSSVFQKVGAQNPGLGMLSFNRMPATHEMLEGFENLQFMVSPQPLVWGVSDGYLIVGSSADAIALCLETGRGNHPNIRQNSRAMAEAVVPAGEFAGVSLTDQRALGEEIAAGIGIASMVGGMASMAIPDPEIKPLIGKIAGILGKLTPVAQKIDFIKSTASCTTFDGRIFRTEMKTHYVSPEERVSLRSE